MEKHFIEPARRASNCRVRSAVEGPVFRGGEEFYSASNSRVRSAVWKDLLEEAWNSTGQVTDG
jgi:hypothetical protein